MKTSICLALSIFLSCVLLYSGPTRAASNDGGWDCPLPLNGDFNGYAQCMQEAAQDSVDATVAAAVQQAVEAVENSPFMANLPAERAMLTMAKNGGLNELAQCLNAAGIQFGTVVSNAAGDPWNLVQHRLNALMVDAMQNSQQRVGNILSGIAAGDTTALNPNNVAALVDEAYALMLDVAAADPVASCALPVLESHAALTKQVSVGAFTQLQQQSQTLMDNMIQPAIDSGMATILGSMLRDMRDHAVQPASNKQRQKPAPAPKTVPRTAPRTAPARTNQTDSGSDTVRKTTTSTASVKRATPVKSTTPVERTATSTAPRTLSRTSPKTRAGSTLFSDVSQQVAAVLQPVAGAMVTNDMERIALAEFTARTMDPQTVTELTWALRRATDRLNGTSNLNANLSQLQNLVDTISLTNEALYSEIALATIKYYGHEVIDLAGEPLVDYAVGTLGGLEAALDNAVGVACSIASVLSGTPCNIIKGIVSFLYQQALVPTMNVAATMAIHVGWEMTADCGADAVRGAINPMAAQGCGETIRSVLKWFPPTAAHAVSYVMPYLDETQAAMREYHAAVLALATAAQNASN